jgi:hypothetical protein
VRGLTDVALDAECWSTDLALGDKCWLTDLALGDKCWLTDLALGDKCWLTDQLGKRRVERRPARQVTRIAALREKCQRLAGQYARFQVPPLRA